MTIRNNIITKEFFYSDRNLPLTGYSFARMINNYHGLMKHSITIKGICEKI